jgi:hypothetical protein
MLFLARGPVHGLYLDYTTPLVVRLSKEMCIRSNLPVPVDKRFSRLFFEVALSNQKEVTHPTLLREHILSFLYTLCRRHKCQGL